LWIARFEFFDLTGCSSRWSGGISGDASAIFCATTWCR
jgi:hypothetical protein